MNGIVYRVKWRNGEKWKEGHYIYDTTPLTEVQSLAQEMANSGSFDEVVVEAQDRNKWSSWTLISTHHQSKKKKRILRKCPWCKQRGEVIKNDDGFYYAGCFGGFCSVSPRTSGQETEDEAIDIWNSFKL